MRTTLDIDEDVLEAAEELAERQNKTPVRSFASLSAEACFAPTLTLIKNLSAGSIAS
jgi:hypothetical protein